MGITMSGGWSCRRRAGLVALLTLVAWTASRVPATAQLGSLLSPGKLAKAHANLEGLSNCQQCHEQGRKVTAAKCLTCHKPIAERVARRSGVHKDVTDECVTCHAEHAGVNGELRPFDPKTFDHADVTGFALDDKHGNLAAGCAACHKQRTFLDVKSGCVSCHADVHKPSLGANCQTCHSTKAAFKSGGTVFDHGKAAFPLAGAHKAVTCEKCHVNQVFKGIAFSSCTSCHKDPHRPALGATCTACHSNDSWRTTRIDHSKTAFTLAGQHQKTPCAACHKRPSMRVKPRSDTCAACHVDVHTGAFKQDCKSCHNETSFANAPFDHELTKFSLTGKHAPLSCEACHKSVAGQSRLPAAKRVSDFRGLATTCVGCHADVHQAQLGSACDSCHSSSSFKVPTFMHTSAPDFFAGQHASLTCEKCHTPKGTPQPMRTALPLVLNVQYRNLATGCASCHEDVHLGQETAPCESCHTVAQAKFALPTFSHAKTTFPLTGKHETTACVLCHKRETGAFPKGHGTAIRYKGLGQTCVACHQDVHLGQVETTCETCHTTRGFPIDMYRHRHARTLTDFFTGAHAKATCPACHKPTTAQFPAGRGTAVRFTVDTGCVSCHTDVHKGALGPDCGNCHRL